MLLTVPKNVYGYILYTTSCDRRIQENMVYKSLLLCEYVYLQNEHNFILMSSFFFLLFFLVLLLRFIIFNYRLMTGYYANNTNMTNNVIE